MTGVTEKVNNRLAEALVYAARGWRVIPLHHISDDGSCSCGKSNCDRSRSKHPRLSGWQHKASTDAATIRGWWKKWPAANIGIVWGVESGAWALDVDGEEGADALAALEAEHGELPRTPLQR